MGNRLRRNKKSAAKNLAKNCPTKISETKIQKAKA